MAEQYIDLGVLEADGTNMFDAIASTMERYSFMYGAHPGFRKQDIEKELIGVENSLTDLEISNHPFNNIIRSEVNQLLAVWYQVWQENMGEASIALAFRDNLRRLRNTISLAEKLNSEVSIKELFSNYRTSLTELKKNTNNHLIAFSDAISFFIKDSIFTKDPFANLQPLHGFFNPLQSLIKKPLIYNVEYNKNKIDPPSYEFLWDVSIRVGGRTTAKAFSYFLWTFIEALENIEGVSVEIESITKGSWYVKLKIWFRDLFAKEDVKAILQKARDSGEALVEKPQVEVEKLKSEREKIDAEREKIELENINAPTVADTTMLRELNIRKLKAEIESIEINSALKKIEGIERISQLARAGILQTDELQIDINELLYLIKRDEVIQIGSSIEDIESKEKRPPAIGDIKPE